MVLVPLQAAGSLALRGPGHASELRPQVLSRRSRSLDSDTDPSSQLSSSGSDLTSIWSHTLIIGIGTCGSLMSRTMIHRQAYAGRSFAGPDDSESVPRDWRRPRPAAYLKFKFKLNFQVHDN